MKLDKYDPFAISTNKYSNQLVKKLLNAYEDFYLNKEIECPEDYDIEEIAANISVQAAAKLFTHMLIIHRPATTQDLEEVLQYLIESTYNALDEVKKN